MGKSHDPTLHAIMTSPKKTNDQISNLFLFQTHFHFFVQFHLFLLFLLYSVALIINELIYAIVCRSIYGNLLKIRKKRTHYFINLLNLWTAIVRLVKRKICCKNDFADNVCCKVVQRLGPMTSFNIKAVFNGVSDC